MRVAICDDVEKDLLELKGLICSFDFADVLEVYTFSTAAELYSAAERTYFDVAILDIEMKPPNGYDIAKKLIGLEQAPIILFVTNSMAYTLRGYGVAFRYLTKPIDRDHLESSLLAALDEASAKHFSFCIDGISHLFRMEDIYYFEVFNHLVVLHTVDQVYSFRASLKDVIADLPVGYFGFPHQSYIVNFNNVKKVMTKELHLTNGAIIPISKRKQQEFDNQLRAYLRR